MAGNPLHHKAGPLWEHSVCDVLLNLFSPTIIQPDSFQVELSRAANPKKIRVRHGHLSSMWFWNTHPSVRVGNLVGDFVL